MIHKQQIRPQFGLATDQIAHPNFVCLFVAISVGEISYRRSEVEAGLSLVNGFVRGAEAGEGLTHTEEVRGSAAVRIGAELIGFAHLSI